MDMNQMLMKLMPTEDEENKENFEDHGKERKNMHNIISEANTLYIRNDFKGASIKYQEALSLDSDDIATEEVYENLAICL